ncbi:hypothetical protein MTR67_051545 [Solanum verrucosum]|uniref:Gag-pol polyprotein n=1 Tax=Solanum verrucosum TaxID=315347 RepID=A0AAF1A2I6_SOLVR|nr:hypothetical protein MTR67_051545 [Solanum verrucosum]
MVILAKNIVLSRNVNPQGQKDPNAPEVQLPHGDVTNAKFRNAIQMLIQVVTTQVFEVMHVVDVERVEMAGYQLKGIARI